MSPAVAHASPPSSDATDCIVLRPHAALSPRQARGLFAGLAVLALVMIAMFLNRGAWPVALCFALTLVAFGAGLYVTCWRSQDCELLVFDEGSLRVIQRRGRHEECHEFQRYWAHVALEPVRDGWYPSRLMIRSHGHALEIGACLNDDERERTAQRLRQLLGGAYRDSARPQKPD